jgi:Uma2 family endonuclease
MRSSAHGRETNDFEEDRAMRMAPDVKAWTVDDLAHMPDDGQRYEVIDGELFVTPSPALRHQDAILALALLLQPYIAAQRIGHLVVAPADVTFSHRRGVQPDLFVASLVNGKRPRELSDIRDLLLAVEVLSPSTVRADRVVKRAMYRDQGVAEYWVVDLERRAIERSTPEDARVEVVADSLKWHPKAATVPLVIDLKGYFADVLDR